MKSWPVRGPVCVGAKLMLNVHVPPTGIVSPVQVSCSTKSPVTSSCEKVIGALPELVTVTVCEALCVETGCAPKLSAVVESVIAGAFVWIAVSNGICQRPRPYVPARSMPRRPSPVGIRAAASSVVTGALGRPVPSGLQQFVEAQAVTDCVTKTPVSSATWTVFSSLGSTTTALGGASGRFELIAVQCAPKSVERYRCGSLPKPMTVAYTVA